MAFAVAELAFGYLNSSTAFLGSIILGNGINYAIVLMSRYEEQRARGDDPHEALRARAGRHAGAARWSRRSAASAAYASLMVTSFRGFSQFGVMGAVGRARLLGWRRSRCCRRCWCCWIARDRGSRAARARAPLELGPLARFVAPARRRVAWSFDACCRCWRRRADGTSCKDPFEYDFRKLNAQAQHHRARRSSSTRASTSCSAAGRRPTIVLADSRRRGRADPSRRSASRTQRPRPAADVIGQIVTIYDLLPGPPEVQQRKLALHRADPQADARPGAGGARRQGAQADLARSTRPTTCTSWRPCDLPPLARRPFTESDGTDRARGAGLPRRAGPLGLERARPAADRARPAAPAPAERQGRSRRRAAPVVFGAMIRSILHDGPIATVASLLAVLVIVAFTIRPARGGADGARHAGAGRASGWSARAGWARVRVTFLNFIALPITFGIGAEYALNVRRALPRGARTSCRAVISTGGAVALCSWTTIVGYGSLLAARNQALQGFGADGDPGRGRLLVGGDRGHAGAADVAARSTAGGPGVAGAACG